jgi:asparagine synthase (glutamine-hydrolysing)
MGELDDVALCAYLQYGCIPPPFALSKTVQRMPGGHVLRWLPNASPRIEPRPLRAVPAPGSDNPSDALEEALDRVLSRQPTGSVVLFSGGVDSSLMAVRLRALGRRDVRLVNYAFSKDDPEGQHAIRVAKALGMPCDQLVHDPAEVPAMVARIGREYSFPFADFSSVPTNLLVQAVTGLAAHGSAVIEGTGADAAFGMWSKHHNWSRACDLPRIVRVVLGVAYKTLGLWKGSGALRLEQISRVCRRAMQMPMRHAVMAQNALDGIAYVIPAPTRAKIEDAIDASIERLSEGLDPITRLSFLDLVQVCAGQFAAKSFDPLCGHGFVPVYPFLEPEVLRASLALPWETKCTGGEDKALLKSMLCRHLPRELIYRRKSGFRPPMGELLSCEAFQGLIDEALSKNSPLEPVLRVPTCRKIADRARRGRPLAFQAQYFLWLLVFLSSWIRWRQV